MDGAKRCIQLRSNAYGVNRIQSDPPPSSILLGLHASACTTRGPEVRLEQPWLFITPSLHRLSTLSLSPITPADTLISHRASYISITTPMWLNSCSIIIHPSVHRLDITVVGCTGVSVCECMQRVYRGGVGAAPLPGVPLALALHS